MYLGLHDLILHQIFDNSWLIKTQSKRQKYFSSINFKLYRCPLSTPTFCTRCFKIRAECWKPYRTLDETTQLSRCDRFSRELLMERRSDRISWNNVTSRASVCSLYTKIFLVANFKRDRLAWRWRNLNYIYNCQK